MFIIDSRGGAQRMTRLCVGVDRDPRLKGSPILLSMTTLTEYHIHLCPSNRKWWFEQQWNDVEKLSWKKFRQGCRKRAHVFAVVQLQEYIPFLEDSEPTPHSDSDLPVELSDFKDVFSMESSAILPSFKSTDHSIDLLEGEEPPYGPIYPLSQAELRELQNYIADNLAKQRIRPSKSSAGAPVLFIPTKDGSLRLCVEYRGLNKITVKNRYPLPLISEIMDRISGAKYFSKIDVKDAYYRIRIKEGDEWKTAFRTRYGHCEYLVMPFGLTNAPATFQHYIHQALGDLLDTVCVAYLDDILIFSEDRESHTKHIRLVLERLRGAELYARRDKCSFYESQVEFLGFIISTEGVSMDPQRIQTILDWKEPTSYHEIQVFLVFCNFYRRFIANYSAITRPLHALMKGSVNGKKPGSVILNSDEKDAFCRLLQAFQEAPLLRHFDPKKPIRIETDASNFAMAGILSQPDDQGRWHPVAFWSRAFRGPELNYGTPDQEMMAIIESFRHWRHYVEGAPDPIEVLSDHQNLQTFMKQTKLNGRQARWCIYLMPYDFVIRHRTGRSNPADGPSRRPDYQTGKRSNTDLLPTLRERLIGCGEMPLRVEYTQALVRPGCDEMSSQGEIPCVQKGDCNPFREASRAIELVGCKQLVSRESAHKVVIQEVSYEEKVVEPLLQMIKESQAVDPELKRRGEDSSLEKNSKWSLRDNVWRFQGRIYIPEEMTIRQEFLKLYYDDPLAGHFGRDRTEELLKRKFYWKNMTLDVRDYVLGCQICQGAVSKKHKPYGKLNPLPLPERPMQELTMDFVTGLPSVVFEGREVDAILVIVDRFTKYTLMFPISTTMTASELAELFYNEVELQFGPPKGIVSDRGSLFASSFWSSLCFYSKIRRRLSTAFHPQTDGQTERVNQVLEQYLRCFVGDNPANWPRLLRTARFSCNIARNATIGMSPYQALYGYIPDFHLDIEDDAFEKGVPDAKLRIEKLDQVRQKLREHWCKAVEWQAKAYDKRHEDLTLSKGDLVGLSTKNLRIKEGYRKLTPRFIGPLRITQKIGQQAYQLALPTKYNRLHDVFHVSLLNPWVKRSSNDGDDTLPMPDLEDDDEWEVESVQDHKLKKKQDYYLVKWKGWPAEYNEWVSSANMEGAQQAVAEYHKSQAKRKRRTTNDASSQASGRLSRKIKS